MHHRPKRPRHALLLAALTAFLVAWAPEGSAQGESSPESPAQALPESAASAQDLDLSLPEDRETVRELIATIKADAAAEAEASTKARDWQAKIDDGMKKVNAAIASVIFYDIWIFDNGPVLENGVPVLDEEGEAKHDKRIQVPFAVAWLIFGAIVFTIRMRFINFRAFGHALDVVRGRYTDPNSHSAGEVTHFQALTAALSATVGLGNIASVAVAVGVGGPGATFWMILAGLLGMTSKFTECTLGQKYREVRADGHVMGGAMFYLSKGLKERGLGALGMVLAPMFAILCIGGSLAGGNSFQVSQSLGALAAVDGFEFLRPTESGGGGFAWAYGALMTFLVAIVIIGGIRRIAQVAEKVVPTMCGVYVLACLTILAMNFSAIPGAFASIIGEAFDPTTVFDMDALKGGMIGVLILGFKRAAFSNEAGIGSAAIAHSAAKTDYPVREGVVALLEPFIDTVVVCTMTALVIVITGVYNDPAHADAILNEKGAALTSAAFSSQIPWFAYVLAAATMLFAFSTMISWSYYGERCWSWLFGEKSSLIYKLLFLTFTFLGSIITATQVLEFGDLMILGMALPNILGLLLLSGGVRRDLDEYWDKKKRGEFPTFK